MVTEKEARHGRFKLFDKPKVEVKIRTLNDMEDWLDDAAEVETLGAVATDRESQRKYNAALYDAVFSYDPTLDREQLETQFSGAQILDAFERLRTELDPFVARRVRADAQKSKQLDEANLILGSLSADAQKLALQGIMDGKFSLGD